MSKSAVKELCGCGVPVFAGDDDVCDTCAREHRKELLEAAKEALNNLTWGDVDTPVAQKVREAIAKAEGGAD